MNTEKRLFAFKLAGKQAGNADRDGGRWTARNDVAIAGCTLILPEGPPREPTMLVSDSDTFC
jgi:hypothetical protein